MDTSLHNYTIFNRQIAKLAINDNFSYVISLHRDIKNGTQHMDESLLNDFKKTNRDICKQCREEYDNNSKCLYLIHTLNTFSQINTLRTGDADLRLYITTVQDGWRKSAFLTRAWFPRTIHLITQYMEHFSEWAC